jgi:predicted TIM-barrel fold metal-dependent hydrolase
MVDSLPLLLEELLARRPKLRVQVMHAGYPMIDNMLTLLQANSHVYVDVAGLIWSDPSGKSIVISSDSWMPGSSTAGCSEPTN